MVVPANAQSGVASWYGRELAGHKTASGERFNPNGYTVAHKTLPLGTRLRISHGGRSVLARVNDRGPYVRGRSLDLSHGVAMNLGCSGVCRVSYQVVN